MIDELVENRTSLEIRFWCDRGYRIQAESLIQQAKVSVTVSTIFAGKLRRYHGSSVIAQILDIPTILHNIFDVFLVILGFFQSLLKLIVWRPNVVFLKGGFVCLPVGYAAYILRIPTVIHDSDAHPGLTNRLLAPLAKYIATGMPLEYYNYSFSKTKHVGIPVKPEFHHYSLKEKAEAKKSFDLPVDVPLVAVIGGGLGAKRINDTLVAIAPELVRRACVVHLSGMAQYNELKDKIPKSDNYKLIDFLSDQYAQLVGAADIVVTRAGASAMAEMAAVGASVIIVPNIQLVGGHQLKNARIYTDKQAAQMADETKFSSRPELLLNQILDLLEDSQKRQNLGKSLYKFAKPQAAKQVAELILRAGKL